VPGAFWRIGIVVDAVGLAMAIMLGVKLLGPDRPGKWRDKYAADGDRSDPDKPTLDRDEAFMLLLLGLGLFTLGPWLTMVIESAIWYV